ncbi:sulfotransferase family protein, partial [Candidatus Woesearchaeota archaeon]|nr:sulfotransferase family protein [Candidatus Woesearchaeota archaeon]
MVLNKTQREKNLEKRERFSYERVFCFFCSNNLIYIHIPKCGTSSVKKMFKLKTEDYFKYKTLNPDLKKKYKMFTVIRNPLDRFVSSFFELLERKRSKENNSTIMNKLRTKLLSLIKRNKKKEFHKSNNLIKNFKIFLEIVEEDFFDIHVFPQSKFLENMEIDYYLRLEHLDNDFKNKLNINIKVEHLRSSDS